MTTYLSQKALHQEPLPVYGRGENIGDWRYVGRGSERHNPDVVRGIGSWLDELRPSRLGAHERLGVGIAQ